MYCIIQSLQDTLKTNINISLFLNIEASLSFIKNHSDSATCHIHMVSAFPVASLYGDYRLIVAFLEA